MERAQVRGWGLMLAVILLAGCGGKTRAQAADSGGDGNATDGGAAPSPSGGAPTGGRELGGWGGVAATGGRALLSGAGGVAASGGSPELGGSGGVRPGGGAPPITGGLAGSAVSGAAGAGTTSFAGASGAGVDDGGTAGAGGTAGFGAGGTAGQGGAAGAASAAGRGGAAGAGQPGCADCTLDHATSICSEGRCAIVRCDDHWGDCDGDAANGCESSLSSSAHCGGCGHSCGPVYPNMTGPTCISDVCIPSMCLAGFGDCDGVHTNGCETDLTRDTSHCGYCGNTCGPDQSCSDGNCG